jgi:surfactin synthase thioesterase subunit
VGTALFCLPPAGGGASGYRHWQAAAGRDVAVHPVQLPGREGRLREPVLTDAAEVADRLAAPLLARAGARYALFGHSMGAILAFELAHRLTELGRPPAHLVVSAHVPPHLLHLREPFPAPEGMTEPYLRDYLARTAGASAELLDLPELMELVLPVLRADLTLCAGYRPRPRPALTVPVTAFGGDADPVARPGAMACWAVHTTAGFVTRTFPGGHGYLHDDPAAIATAVASAAGTRAVAAQPAG